MRTRPVDPNLFDTISTMFNKLVYNHEPIDISDAADALFRLRLTPNIYKLDLNSIQQEEVESMLPEEWMVDFNEGLSRRQWVAIGYMAMGKAQRARDGGLGPNDAEVNTEDWANDLQSIADLIFNKFKEADGQI